MARAAARGKPALSVRALLMAASGADPQPSTWDPMFKSATLALSAANLTATASVANYNLVRSTRPRFSGKRYWEVTLNQLSALTQVGFANASVTTTEDLRIPAYGVAFTPGVSTPQGMWFFSTVLNQGTVASLNGAVVSFAFDITNKLLWVSTAVMRAAGKPWNNSATANPSTNTGGQSLAGLAPGPYFACFSGNANGDQATANFGASAFTVALPTGFSQWT